MHLTRESIDVLMLMLIFPFVDETQERQDDDLIFDTRVLDDFEIPVEAKVDGKNEQSTKKLDDSTAGEVVTTAGDDSENKEKKEEGREETAKGSRKKMLGRKRAVKEQQEESSKKQIKKDDDIAIDAIPLATKLPMIIKYKLHKEGMLVHYELIRADGSSKRYSSMIRMLQGIEREDLEALWRIVKGLYGDHKA
ncbi:hypothetical protein Tco_0610719 [Tanacetum coccineum]